MRRIRAHVCVVAAGAAGVVLLAAAPVGAQTADEVVPAKTPVIDRAPTVKRFNRGARIVGHLQNGVKGDRVRLERRRPRDEWRWADAKPVDDRARVAFNVDGMRMSTRFRLVYVDRVSGDRATSNERLVRVRPKLRVRTDRRHVLKGRRVTVRGVLRPAVGGRRVRVQKRVDGRWRTVARPRAGDGTFRTRAVARPAGRRPFRVRFRGDAFNTARTKRRAIRVYRRALATWYGPGFYGNRTACGQRLTRDTLGVAHRKLPCGTEVSILYGDRTITVPVIDRGPYTSADWDLTSKTANRLDFAGRDHVGITK